MMIKQTPVHKSDAWLDTLRGLAASAVVFFHINEGIEYQQRPYHSLVKLGWLGVPVFFVISGYLIVSSALRNPDWRSFCIRRWWRIYPPYVASLGLTIALAVFRKLSTGTNDIAHLSTNPVVWLATLTLTTNPVTNIPTVNWVYWSLSCEVAFYAAIALVLYLWPKRLPWAIGAITVLCLIPGLPHWTQFFTQNWWMFALGATLAFVLLERRRLGIGLLALCLIGPLLWAAGSAWYFPVAVAGATWLSILWSKSPSGAWLNRERVLSGIGVFSYSLYLTHVPMGFYVAARFRPRAALTNLPIHLVCDLLIYLFCLAFAWGFYRLIEKPAHNRGRRRQAMPRALSNAASSA